jgi:hypothetical protein
MIALPFESGSALLQRRFAEAIFSDDLPLPATMSAATGPAVASRFGVYRNNVIASLMRAVAARYPAVRRLLWDDAFERVARRYVVSHPPRSPVMHEYGEDFADFLRGIGEGSAVESLVAVAKLEAARTRAYHAPEAMPLDCTVLAALDPERLAASRVELHPSVTLVRSQAPMVSLWESAAVGEGALTSWSPECALIARPHADVMVWRVSAGACAFMAALGRGCPVAAAVEQASQTAPDFALQECFDLLVGTGIVVGLSLPDPWADAHM